MAILCCGLATVVMAGGDDVVKGGIDLSLPANAVLVAAIIAQLLAHGGVGLPIAFAAGALAGLAIGAANALLVVAIGMTPLLATLASSVAVVGLAKVVTSNRRINVDGPVVTILRDGTVLGVPVAVLLMAAVGAGFVYALHWTRWGLQLQAVGGNRDAADISGLPSDRRTVQAFVVAALAAVIAAPTILARGSGSSPGSGGDAAGGDGARHLPRRRVLPAPRGYRLGCAAGRAPGQCALERLAHSCASTSSGSAASRVR